VISRAAVLGTLVALLVLSGCRAVVSIPDTSGIRIYPESRNQLLYPGEVVSISFGQEVDRQSVEDIFFVEEAAGRLAGSYRWEPHRVAFVPDKLYVSGRRYAVTFSGSFEDKEGIPYTVHHFIPFFFESAGEPPPSVVSVEPPGGSTLGVRESIVIAFSAAVDPATLLRGITITPALDIEREVDPDDATGRRVVLRPGERWESFTVYTLTVSEELEDADGRPLASEFQTRFLAQQDASAPALLAAEATANDPGTTPPFSGPGSEVTAPGYELLPADVFRLAFSEAMDREATARALSFSPGVAGETFWPSDSVLVFVPDGPLRPGVAFTLMLGGTAADLSGIPLANPLSVHLVATTEALSVTVNLPEEGIALENSQEESAVRIRPGLSPDYAHNIVVGFSAPFDSDADKLAVRHAIRLTTVLSNDFTPPYLVGYSWPTNREIHLTYHNVVPSSETQKNYLLLSLPGGATGIASTAGNELEEDLRILLLSEAD
jgi:hypothetical protein